MKNCTNFAKLMKNGMSEKIFLPPANNFAKRNINLQCPSGTTLATPFWLGKTSSSPPPHSRNTQVTARVLGRDKLYFNHKK
jgi:hypothetical protein